MKLARIFISLLTLLLISCSEQNHEAHQQESLAPEHVQHSSKMPTDTLGNMSLNQEQRWLMDEHTRAIFLEMAISFANYDHSAMDSDDLKKVGANLQTDIDTLIQGCTMTEEAHDQLHIFLTGYIPAVTALTENGQLEDAKKVAHYLNGYQHYFQ